MLRGWILGGNIRVLGKLLGGRGRGGGGGGVLAVEGK